MDLGYDPRSDGHLGALSSRRILCLVTLSWSSLAGCFALFELDGYGPPREEALADAAPPPADVSPEASEESFTGKIVFVTSARFNGGFGGGANADDLCQSAAEEAGLSGIFKAWLSGPSASPSTRFSAPEDGGFGERLVTPDRRKIIAPSIAALPWGLFTPIAMTELGTTLPATTVTFMTDGDGQRTCSIEGEMVWTNTSPEGTRASSNDCNGWSVQSGAGMVGVILGEDAGPTNDWTTACPQPCSLEAHLYCFEQ